MSARLCLHAFVINLYAGMRACVRSEYAHKRLHLPECQPLRPASAFHSISPAGPAPAPARPCAQADLTSQVALARLSKGALTEPS